MDAVILFSHGSLLCGAGQTLEAHAARLWARGLAPAVTVAYLNYNTPTLLEATAQCVAAGADRVVVAPYFLISGYFVKVDVPKVVSAAQATLPNVRFDIAEPIGFDMRLAEALVDSAREAAAPSAWREDLRRAAAFCRVDPTCPLYGTPDCPGIKSSDPPPEPDARAAPAPLPPSARDALLVLVHGSPHPIANEDMFRVVKIIKAQNTFPIVEVGFLECNEPSIPQAIDACAEQGAERILAVPYFLHTGKHVADDLPTLLEAGQQRHPALTFRMGAYLGRSEHLTDILQDRIESCLV